MIATVVKTNYSWNDIVEICKTMVAKIHDSPTQMQFSCLFAIPRGGLVPARIVSELLDIKRIVTNINDVKQNDAVLIIDDISDSGKTLVKIINKFKETIGYSYKVATLFVRDGTHYEPNFYGERLNHDKWIEFPWESKMLASLEPIRDPFLDIPDPEQDW